MSRNLVSYSVHVFDFVSIDSLRYYRRGIDLGADDEQLVTLGLRQLRAFA